MTYEEKEKIAKCTIFTSLYCSLNIAVTLIFVGNWQLLPMSIFSWYNLFPIDNHKVHKWLAGCAKVIHISELHFTDIGNQMWLILVFGRN